MTSRGGLFYEVNQIFFQWRNSAHHAPVEHNTGYLILYFLSHIKIRPLSITI